MRTRIAILAAAVSLAAATPRLAWAQGADARYMSAPADIATALAASEMPQPILSPARNVAALITLRSLPTIEELAQPMLRLAGRRINPETNNAHFAYQAPSIAALSLMTLPDGQTRPVN